MSISDSTHRFDGVAQLGDVACSAAPRSPSYASKAAGIVISTLKSMFDPRTELGKAVIGATIGGLLTYGFHVSFYPGASTYEHLDPTIAAAFTAGILTVAVQNHEPLMPAQICLSERGRGQVGDNFTRPQQLLVIPEFTDNGDPSNPIVSSLGRSEVSQDPVNFS
jgi:hypothetical protein